VLTSTVPASSSDKKISRDYGVLIEDRGIALRGLFVIDSEVVEALLTGPIKRKRKSKWLPKRIWFARST